ncbi:MAG: hypothetical protein WCV67_07960 [Victivallaceae bacterium]|jgi:hypothetical protein
MLILDCENPASALKSISEIYGMEIPEIVAFLKAFDIEKYYENNAAGDYPDRVLAAAFEKKYNVEPMPLDYVCWFHLTRTLPRNSFPEGILPLPQALDILWETLLALFGNSPHCRNLADLKAQGLINERYESRIKRPYLAGPYAVLVRDIAFRPEEAGFHDWLAMPEIMTDICDKYQETYKVNIFDQLQKKLAPCIVKFVSDRKTGRDCIESALYYLYVLEHNERLTESANTCFDGQNEKIPHGQIKSIEYR